jgi:hypothetical protein
VNYTPTHGDIYDGSAMPRKGGRTPLDLSLNEPLVIAVNEETAGGGDGGMGGGDVPDPLFEPTGGGGKVIGTLTPAPWIAPLAVPADAWNASLKTPPPFAVGEGAAAFDASGVLHCVGARFNDAMWSYDVFYTAWNGSSWSSPLNLSSNRGDSGGARIAVDGQGTVYVVWQDNSVLQNQNNVGQYAIYCRTLSSGSWSGISSFSDSQLVSSSSAIAARGDRVAIVWQDRSRQEICFLEGSRDQGWLFPPVMISRNTYHHIIGNPSVAIDGSGNFYVAWSDTDIQEIYCARRTGTSWQEPENISQNPGQSAPPLVVTSDARVAVLWADSTIGNYEIACRVWDGAWGDTLNLSQDTASSEGFAVALDSRGIIHLVYESSGRLLYTQGNGAIFTTPVIVSGAEPVSWPCLTLRSSGALALLWSAGDSTVQPFLREWVLSSPAQLTAAAVPTGDLGNTRIVFVRTDRDSAGYELYLMRTDGTNIVRLTYNEWWDTGPVWSPDGKQIAFCSKRDNNWDIYVITLETLTETRLTSHPAVDTTPHWSPDGTEIAFCSNQDGNYELYTMQPDGTGKTRLTTTSADEQSPSWSPDSRKLVFVSNMASNWDICTIDRDGKNFFKLTSHEAADVMPRWSPDGKQVIFVSNREGNNEIYLMHADGTNLVRLTNNTTTDAEPTWSPDGTRIAFRDSNWDISSMTSDGKYIQKLTGAMDDDAPVWSPFRASFPIGTPPLQASPSLAKAMLSTSATPSPVPDKTALLPVFPNPANPETWIPYQLSRDARVVLTIYDVRGTVVRRIEIGTQQAGYYETQGSAAHWDGRNNAGEQVASGLYFARLTAGEFTATRKLLMRK